MSACRQAINASIPTPVEEEGPAGLAEMMDLAERIIKASIN